MNQTIVFRILWSLAVLFHYNWYDIQGDVFQPLLCAVALFILFKPTSKLFILIPIIQITEYGYLAPVVPNHWTLFFVVNVGLLICSLFKVEAWQKTLASICIAFYSFTFFWKLNYGFIDLKNSCAVLFTDHIFAGLLATFPFLTAAIIFLTLIIEGLFPITLLFQKTRRYGFLLAVIFHFVLIFDFQKNFLNFSSVMFPLLFLFIKGGRELLFVENLIGIYKKHIITILLLILYLMRFGLVGDQLFLVFALKTLVALVIYSTLLIFVFVNFKRLKGAEFKFTEFSFPQAITVLLVFLIGLSPLFGLRTGSTWQMYSNLYLSPKESNHFFVTRSLPVTNNINDYVEILSVQNRESSLRHLEGAFLQRLELERICYRSNCSGLRYRQGRGVPQNINPEQLKVDYQKRSLFEQKFQRFVPFRKTNQQGCYW